jgi:Kef-type K+ transport system membrane component KefB
MGSELRNNLRHPVSILLLQVIIVLAAARAVGALLRKVGQPTVIGEMIAGILLGPSLLGWLTPQTMTFLFPPDSMGALRLLSQIGVIIFMFVVGTEVNVQHIRQKAHAAVKASGFGSAISTILLSLLFIGLMLFVLKRQADRVISAYLEAETQRRGLIAIILIFCLASALMTEIIGIHALFGAFMAGVIMPSTAGLRKFLSERIEIFTSSFLLPLFFAFTGLRTQIGLLNSWSDWLMCAGVIAVAIAGKFVGSALAARWTGMDWHDSLSLGALMNTRGLMELIVLNIGYDLGVLSPRIFSMMVIMALVTTFMAAPFLSLLELLKRRHGAIRTEIPDSTGAY